MRLLLLPLVVLATLVFVPSAMTGAEARPPVIKYQDDVFGPVLTTRSKQALYYWNVEKRAGGKIRCKGGCARSWPPLIVRRRSAVPRRIAGIPGRFGVIGARTDGCRSRTEGCRSTRTRTSSPSRCSATTLTAGSSFDCASRT